jgi:RNA polymerase sigma-70 factor, ECF subfamily
VFVALRQPDASDREGSHGSGTRGGDLDFDVLYRETAPKVARWAARLGGPGIDAADVVQEVFIVAFRRRDTLRPDVKATTWLFGITLRVVQAHRRKQGFRRWFMRHRAPQESMSFSGPTPIESLEQKRAEAKAYRILDAMSPKYREAFILFELEGMSTHEISELLGKNQATVKVWLHRARGQFTERLAAIEDRGEGRA